MQLFSLTQHAFCDLLILSIKMNNLWEFPVFDNMSKAGNKLAEAEVTARDLRGAA